MDGSGFGLQAAFNVAAGLAGALGAFVLKGVKDDLRKVQTDHDALVRSMPETYARRDDLKSMGDELKARLVRIEDKLDRLADK